jgi:hypothetical protein
VFAEDGAESPHLALRRDRTWTEVDVPAIGGIVAAETSPGLGVVVQTSRGEVAAWNGTSWTSLADGGASAIAACDTGVYAAFTTGTESPTRTLALYNGTGWAALAPAVPGVTTRLLATDQEVWVGGGTPGDAGLARWRFPAEQW